MSGAEMMEQAASEEKKSKRVLAAAPGGGELAFGGYATLGKGRYHA
jgi:hypothetical protein